MVGKLLDTAFEMVEQDKADVVDISNQPLWFQQVVVQTGKVIYETELLEIIETDTNIGKPRE